MNFFWPGCWSLPQSLGLFSGSPNIASFHFSLFFSSTFIHHCLNFPHTLIQKTRMIHFATLQISQFLPVIKGHNLGSIRIYLLAIFSLLLFLSYPQIGSTTDQMQMDIEKNAGMNQVNFFLVEISIYILSR